MNKQCYICGCELNNNNRSEEHVIHNALGGMLKTFNILCGKHNKELNDDIDSNFINIFKPIYERMKIKRDRRGNKNRSISGKHLETNRDVCVNEDKVFPIKPLWDANNKIIYAKDERTGQDYLKKLHKDGVIDELIIEKSKVCSDLPGNIQFGFNLENRYFKRGIAKIAVGFASICGIERELIKVIDSEKCKIVEKPIVIPFIPCSTMNNCLYLGTESFYSMHILCIYNNKEMNVLYCYIELFSTFKYIVILNENYKSNDICKRYFYDISKGEEVDEKQYFSYLHTKMDISVKEIKDKFGKRDLNKLCEIAHNDPQCIQQVHTFDFVKLEKYIDRKKVYRKMRNILLDDK